MFDRSLSFLLIVVSLSVVVSGYSSISEFAGLEEVEDGRTYEFDSFEEKFYETRAKNCTKPGPMCDDCLTLYTCIQIGAGFIKQKLEDCAPGTCLESAAVCTTGPNLECDDNIADYNFTCHQLGVFPDPFNCQKYHLCLPDGTDEGVLPESFVRKCSGTYYYDPKTTLCRRKLVNNTCPIIAQPCTNVGQTGVVPNNPALYYICLRGENTTTSFPNFFICPDGEEFDLISRVCVDSSPVSAVGPDGKCVKAGRFYDPTNCFYYYECTGIAASPIRRLCESKEHFDHVSQKCIDFTCNDGF